jgi:hypothetical protein
MSMRYERYKARPIPSEFQLAWFVYDYCLFSLNLVCSTDDSIIFNTRYRKLMQINQERFPTNLAKYVKFGFHAYWAFV